MGGEGPYIGTGVWTVPRSGNGVVLEGRGFEDQWRGFPGPSRRILDPLSLVSRDLPGPLLFLGDVGVLLGMGTRDLGPRDTLFRLPLRASSM